MFYTARIRRARVAVVIAIGAGAVAASSLAAAQTPAPPAAGQTLPGGATQVQETHGDWRVTCAQPNGEKVCVLTQQLADKTSGQRVMGIELKAMTPDKAQGSLVLPFGLAVDKPVTLQIDAGTTITTHVHTCLPVGCVAALSFDAATIASLRQGVALNVTAATDGGGKDAAFKMSLSGFGSALDRTAALSH